MSDFVSFIFSCIQIIKLCLLYDSYDSCGKEICCYLHAMPDVTIEFNLNHVETLYFIAFPCYANGFVRLKKAYLHSRYKNKHMSLRALESTRDKQINVFENCRFLSARSEYFSAQARGKMLLSGSSVSKLIFNILITQLRIETSFNRDFAYFASTQ